MRQIDLRKCSRALAAIVAVGVVLIGIAAAPSARIPSDGAYSDAQAARGEALYARQCRGCHGPQLAGTEFGPGLTGAEFAARWKTRSAAELFDVIRSTMPVNSPGALTVAQYADLVAFILKRAGVSAGASDFAPRVEARATPASSPPSAEAPPPLPVGWYTEEQAARGKTLFMRHCAWCHFSGEPSTVKTDAQPERGFAVGDLRNVRDVSFRRYPNVYHLFRRVRDSMPAWDIESISPVQKLDIVAYLLKINKLPAGSTELGLDTSLMKRMSLLRAERPALEKGFESLFDGKRIAGMKYLFGFNCTPAPAGCGRTDPSGVIHVQNGVILAAGRYHGMMYTEKKYLDFDLRFDYRWVPPPDLDVQDEFFNVSADYFIFIEEPFMFPKSMEIEGDEKGPLRAVPLGTTAKSTFDTEMLERHRKPVGRWNSVQVVALNGQVKAYLNGALITHVSEHQYKKAGHIGFAYQGGRVEWRNIRVKGEGVAFP